MIGFEFKNCVIAVIKFTPVVIAYMFFIESVVVNPFGYSAIFILLYIFIHFFEGTEGGGGGGMYVTLLPFICFSVVDVSLIIHS